MNKIEIIATVFSLIGNIFIVFQNKIGFGVWIVSNLLWIKFGLREKHYWLTGLFAFYTLLAVIGLLTW